MVIEIVIDKEDKGTIVSEILADLPQWFGLPDSTAAYVSEAAELPLWVARICGKPIGFITLKSTSAETSEIHCMGVLKSHHGNGIGRALFERAIASLEGKKLIQVKTVAKGYYEEYDGTNAFYRSLGFIELEVFPEMWDPWNPCLIMVKCL